MNTKFNWVQVSDGITGEPMNSMTKTYIAEVPGGYLFRTVKEYLGNISESMVFVPKTKE